MIYAFGEVFFMIIPLGAPFDTSFGLLSPSLKFRWKLRDLCTYWKSKAAPGGSQPRSIGDTKPQP